MRWKNRFAITAKIKYDKLIKIYPVLARNNGDRGFKLWFHSIAGVKSSLIILVFHGFWTDRREKITGIFSKWIRFTKIRDLKYKTNRFTAKTARILAEAAVVLFFCNVRRKSALDRVQTTILALMKCGKDPRLSTQYQNIEWRSNRSKIKRTELTWRAVSHHRKILSTNCSAVATVLPERLLLGLSRKIMVDCVWAR